MSRKRLISITAMAAVSVLALSVPIAQASHVDDTMAQADCVLEPGGVSGQAETGGEDGVNSVMTDMNNGGGLPPLELFDTDPGHFNFSGNAICTGVDNAAEDNNQTGPEVFPHPTEDENGQPRVGPVISKIIASGDYDNLVCGTGTANGDAVLRAPDGPDADTLDDVQIYAEFGIMFVAGTGELKFVIDADETEIDNGGGQEDTAPDGSPTHAGGAGEWVGSDMDIDGYPGHSYAVTYDADPTTNSATETGSTQNQIDGGIGNGVINIIPDEARDGGNCADQNVTQFLVDGAFTAFLSGEGSADSDDTEPNQTGDSDL